MCNALTDIRYNIVTSAPDLTQKQEINRKLENAAHNPSKCKYIKLSMFIHNFEPKTPKRQILKTGFEPIMDKNSQHLDKTQLPNCSGATLSS